MNFSTLPHKNLFISGTIAILIIAVGIIVQYKPDLFSKTEKVNVVPQAESIASSTITTRDTDGDGLPDWEEQLYGTDPRKTDTDGDKTSDGEEVRLERNPIRANTATDGSEPNDYNPNSSLLLASSSELSEQKKAFLAQFLAQAGKDIRETTYRDLLSKFDAKQYTPTKQELTGLNIVSDNTNDGFRTFISEFGKVVLKHKTSYAPRNEVDILNEYTQTKNAALLKDLELCIIEYQNFVKDLKNLPIPSGNAKTMQSIIEGYDGMTLGINGIRQIETNPIDATGGYEGYTMYRVQVANGYATLVNELSTRGLIFTESDPGYMFYANMFTATSTPQ